MKLPRGIECEEADLWKGLAAGLAGGLIASFAMEQFQSLWSKVSDTLQKKEKPAPSRAKPTTVKVADAITKQISGHKVPRKQQKLAGEAVHYAMGGLSGAVYGVAAEFIPTATAGEGLGFGATVWLLADEVSVPALRLSKPPTKIPVSTHLYALASHLVYGVATEAVRRALRSGL